MTVLPDVVINSVEYIPVLPCDMSLLRRLTRVHNIRFFAFGAMPGTGNGFWTRTL
jgi:hypothetical protein